MASSLSILNDPPKLLDGPQLLHHLIPWSQHIDSCALDCTSNTKSKIYSYSELLSCANSLQARIQDALSTCQSANTQHIVPVLLPQSPGLYISQIAILRSGGAFCPINLDAPKERIKFVVGDVSANLIITTSVFKDTVSWQDGPKVIFVDEYPEPDQTQAAERKPSRDATASDLAYVIYTSGSSGKPKGVAVSHLAVTQSLLAHERHIPKFQRFLQFAAPSFDVSVFEIFFPLVRGSTLVGCERSQLLNDLPGMITKLNIDAAELTPTVVGSLLQKRSQTPGLKLLLTIGEMLTRPIVEEFGGSESRPNMLYGMYGPTEAAIHCTIYPEMEASAKPGNIGIPFDTVSTFIVAPSESAEDASDLKFLHVGELGELVLGGPQLASGYLNRPEQNKLAFVEFEGRNYYRTGDKARQLENGTIEILGRISAGQVKLRGQRVELGEIEDAIYKHPGVKTVSAIVFANTLLVFALVNDASVKSEDVMQTCLKWLPKFMVPSEIILLQKFPYLPSGKVDKKKLESDYQEERANMDHDDSKSANKTEQTVKRILQEILGPFPSSTRLAAAGLDSLVSIRVASKLRSLGYVVSTISVLQADTLRSLAQLCDSTTESAGKQIKSRTTDTQKVTSMLNGHAKDLESSMPCTPLQSAMLSETAINKEAYRNWIELDLPGIDDIDLVIDSLCDLASANPILRTGFAESQTSDGYVQLVWRNFEESQIEEVDEFTYDFDRSKDTSLHHPIRMQILQAATGTRLLIHIHHALYDAWSLELLLDDLDAILGDRSIPDRENFGEVVDAYTDGTLNIDDWSHKDYWKDHLAHLEIVHMPKFHPELENSPGLAVSHLETSIPFADVEKCSRSLSVSPQSLFQAAYALLLGSYLGSSDICFGSVFSGRTLPITGIEDIVGPCMATLPVRVDLSTSATLRDLVQELNGTNRKHLQHSILPLRSIKACSGVSPRQLLFDTLLIWQQTLHNVDHKRDNVILVDTLDNLEFNLTLEIIPTASNIQLKANYQRSIFPSSQITTLLRQVEQLVHAIMVNSNGAIEDAFDCLGHGQLSIENEIPDPTFSGMSLSSPVEKVAADEPGRIAIYFAKSLTSKSIDADCVSYSQLNSRSNQMGNCLLELGVLPNELVCICMEKCSDLYTSILATAKIGAGYLPLTPDVPRERLEHILREAKVEFVMAQSNSRFLFKSLRSIKIVYVDEVNFDKFSSNNIRSRSAPDNVSYCVFTSGSTGTPKGVIVTQGNLISNLDVLQKVYPSSKKSRFLQSCSQAFDVSVFEIFFAWRVGGCICSATKDVLFQDIEHAIRALEITHLSLTPTVAALVSPSNVPRVQFLVTAGEAVTPKVFNAWADRGLWQGYGPSETTNICTVNPRVSRHHAINNIGRPLRNTSAFVLAPGPEFALVPRGGVGEFCFGGSQVFRGYMDTAQNAGKIIEHPQYGRLYRSGDFGRLMPDGSLAFTGRKDDQVKIRGQRVELGEINNILLRSDKVKDCVTMVIDGETDNSQRLVCFWASESVFSEELESLHPETNIIEELYAALNSTLPVYMIPSSLVPISFLPSTPQGKIDKRQLIQLFHELDVRYLDMASAGVSDSQDHTWTALERTIAHALAKVTNLDVEEIQADTSFFNLGIDSISAISFSRILREKIEVSVTISDILKYPSVTRLAERLSSRTEKSHATSLSNDTDTEFGFEEIFRASLTKRFEEAGKTIEAILPCTPLQEAMLSAAETSTESLYNNSVTLKIHGNVQRFQACWQTMVQRHEILRTCFVSTDLKKYPYVQVVLSSYETSFASTEGNGLQALEPPYCLKLNNSEGSVELSIFMHHALYDGVAMAVLFEEVEKLYRHECLPPSVSFAPFLKSVAALDLTAADSFWESTLGNAKTSSFESSRPALPKATSKQPPTRINRTSVNSSLHSVESLIKKSSTSLLAVCHAAWASLLSEEIQETDVCFGNVVSGRTIPVDGIERLVAPCFNTIPTCLQKTHDLTYLEAFRKLQSLNADSNPFQLTPLRRIQSKFSPDGSRLFDTLFILQQSPRTLDSSIWTLEEDTGAMDFPLVCEVVPRRDDDTLDIILHSYTSILSDTEAVQILQSFEEKLRLSLDNPRRPLISTAKKDEILAKIQSREEQKVDRSPTEGMSAPMSPKEVELRNIISEFTDVPVDRIGRDVSIFRLGLDSISTVQVATRLRKQGYSVLASDILGNPSIAQLSQFLSRSGHNAEQAEEYDFKCFDQMYRAFVCEKININTKDVEAVRPCTAVQQGMLAQTLHSEGKEYVNSVWFELLSNIDISKLKHAWTVVCQKHEMLRTVFCSTEDSKHPFVMVTYNSTIPSLPWYENDEVLFNSRPSLEDLKGQPWSLHLSQEGGKRTIRLIAHHALYDVQSIQMILEDVASVYSQGVMTPRPSLDSTLGAIIRSTQDDLSAKQEFWQQEENKIIVNKFPDLTPLQVSGSSSAVREITSLSTVVELDARCRDHGVTMQAASQAAWARVLAEYIGETSTTFGITLSGRSVSEDADKTSFPTIVTVPVRCDITGRNRDLLTRTMESNALLHKHQFTPLTLIQKWAGYPEGKIFDTLFAYQKLPIEDGKASPPWNMVKEEASVDYVVSLEVQPAEDDTLVLRLTFRQDLIPVEQADLILQQYDAMLLDLLQNPEGPCDVFPSARNELLSITAAEEAVLPGSVNLLHEFVERGARQWPEKTALEFATCLEVDTFKSTSWTYTRLDQEANKVAHLLLQHGVTPGDLVAICFDKCAEASFATIGILKAGCAFVALDPTAGADRLKFIVEDSAAKIILTAGEPGKTMLRLLENNTVINLDSPGIVKGLSIKKPALARAIKPEDTGYCLYTSGTTGTPKGCLITHENTVQFMLAFSILFADHWTEDSKYLQFASFHFDVSVMEQFWSWSVGICVASAPRDLIFEDIKGAINQLQITHIDLTPSLARTLHPDDVPTLCRGAFITGGEQLKQEILDVWGEHAVIYNGYGPTEATIGCTMYCRVPKNGKPANIGPAYANAGSFVLKRGTELPVLRGGVGELCVSGKLVGKGYLNRPDLTAEKFPTLKGFDERVYRTGDLVRILHDGSFIFLGRADDQVKLRGQRLELSEINQVIKKGVTEIEEVVTLVLKHSTQQKEQLVTFFVTSSAGNEGTIISSMREACKSRLPGYMVPTHFIPIKKLPLNANNKADAKQLAAMYNELTVEQIQYLSQSSQNDKEWSEKEKPVVEIISLIMDINMSSLTRSSNIFELGTDSISIIGFSRALQNAGLENAKLSVVKSNPSIGSLVRALLENAPTNTQTENALVAATQNIAAFSQRHMISVCRDLGAESSDVECISPCTAIQEGMIYRFLESDAPLYFNKFEFQLHDGVNLDKLKAAWQTVIGKLEVLRTKFVATDDGYAQVVLKEVDDSWKDFAMDYDNIEKGAALIHPYKLDFTSDKNYSLQIFHGLYDGKSLAMLLRCVVDEYRGLKVEYGPSFTSSLPHGPLAQVPAAEGFWNKHLANWSANKFEQICEVEDDVNVTSSIQDIADFEELRKKLGVAPQALVQAAWLSVLQTITSSSLTIGIVTSGRAIDLEGADKIIGPLFNTVPFHTNIEPGTTSASLISRCHDFNMQMQDFQHTPLKDIQKWSLVKPGQALFESLFVFERPDEDEENYAKDIWTLEDGETIADYPLAFEARLNPNNSELSLTLVAQGNIMTKEKAAEVLGAVERALRDVIESDGKNVISTGEAGKETMTNHTFNNDFANPSFSGSNFIWTADAQKIRLEIASLAKISEDSIQGHSSIFELGLDSIDVIKLSSRMKKQGLEIPVSVIIKCQTIANMLGKISKGRSTKVAQGRNLDMMSLDLLAYLEKTGKLPADVERVLPATPLQQSMVNEMISSGYKRYFNVDGFKLADGVDDKKLLEAIKMVVDQSPILRTTFVEIEDPKLPVTYAQLVHEVGFGDVASHSTDLADGLTFEAYMNQFQIDAADLAAKNGWLLQIQTVSIGELKYLVIAISHALYDGTSLKCIHEDIQRAYNQNLSLRANFEPYLEQVFESTSEDAKKFWRTTLSNLPPAQLPRKADVTKVETTRIERRSRVSLKEVEALCKSSRITLQTLGQTCWAFVLSHLMGQLDVVFGSVLSCRDTEEASEIMFPLMNTVAVRSVLHGTLDEMLRYMQNMSDTTRQYQHFPLGTAQAYALASRQTQSSNNDTTLFHTLFIYQGRRYTKGQDQLYESVYGSSDVEFPVCVEMEIVDDDYIAWTTACKSDARDAAETEQIINCLETVLDRIISDSQAQTIVSDASGVSVCRLPKFKISQTTTTRPQASTVNGIDDEWSITELAIRKALHEVSHVPENTIQKDSSIFHLGLDSISVLKLPALLKTYGVKLNHSTILREQTVFAMAKAASKTDSQSSKTIDVDGVLNHVMSSFDISSQLEVLEHEVGKVAYTMPATAGEIYMIKQWRASQGAMFYQTFTYSLPGPIKKNELKHAWNTLLARHDILRTGFLEIGSQIVQVVFENPENNIIYSSSEGPEPVTRKSNSDLMLPPLNLVVEDADHDSVTLKLILHHALYDGISLPILVEELQGLYKGQQLSRSSLSFKNFVAETVASSTFDTKQRWISYLNGETSYPTRRNTKLNARARTELYHPSNKIKPLHSFAQANGLTIDSLFLAAIAKIYAQHLQSSFQSQERPSHVIFGVYLANRAPFGEDLSSLAAPTLNLLPLCISNPLDRPIKDVARDVQNGLSLISQKDMVGASLEQICQWTGTRVNCFVNILKSTNPNTACDETEIEWKPVQDLGKRAEFVEEVINDAMTVLEDVEKGAYLPSLDIELRYNNKKAEVDMGIFAPSEMLDIELAESIVQEFVSFWR